MNKVVVAYFEPFQRCCINVRGEVVQDTDSAYDIAILQHNRVKNACFFLPTRDTVLARLAYSLTQSCPAARQGYVYVDFLSLSKFLYLGMVLSFIAWTSSVPCLDLTHTSRYMHSRTRWVEQRCASSLD
jgi:hypothetical protein